MHLTTIQHGAYDLILFSYYKNQGPLPDDDDRMARVAKLSVSDWQAMRSAISDFFQIKDGMWFHKRADYELQRRKSAQTARRQAAKVTNEARWGPSVTDTVTESVSDRKSVAIHNHNHSTERKRGKAEKPSIEQVLLLAAKTGLPETEGRKFHAHYESNGWKVGKNPMRSVNGAIAGWKLRWQEQGGVNGQPNPTQPQSIQW